MDEHVKVITMQVEELENLFQLFDKQGTKKVSELDIDTVVQLSASRAQELLAKDKVSLFSDAFSCVAILAAMDDRLQFYGYYRVDFSKFPNKERILPCLTGFQSVAVLKKSPDKNIKRAVNGISKLLDVIDRGHLQLRYELPYRLLRVFVLLLIHGMYVEASTVSSLIIHQLEKGAHASA